MGRSGASDTVVHIPALDVAAEPVLSSEPGCPLTFV